MPLWNSASDLQNSLSNASTGTGTVLDNGSTSTYQNHVMTVTVGAGVTSGAVLLEGSDDDVTYHPLETLTVAKGGGNYIVPGYNQPGTYRYIRPRITTNFVGGTITVHLRSF